jgi:transposase
MPSSKPPYPAAFREQVVELARAGRSLKQLAREFGVSANSIRNWVQHAGAGAPESALGAAARGAARR